MVIEEIENLETKSTSYNDLITKLLEGEQYKTKYQTLINFLKFQIENKETYISVETLKNLLESLEPSNTGGESNE